MLHETLVICSSVIVRVFAFSPNYLILMDIAIVGHYYFANEDLLTHAYTASTTSTNSILGSPTNSNPNSIENQ